MKLVNLRRVCTSRAESAGMTESVNEINSPLSSNSKHDIQTNPIIFLTQVSAQCSIGVIKEHRICATIPGQLGLCEGLFTWGSGRRYKDPENGRMSACVNLWF